MKRTLWVASSVAVLALPIGAAAARGMAGSGTADLGSLQQAIGSKTVLDLTTTRKISCQLDIKTGNNCGPTYQGKHCPCP